MTHRILAGAARAVRALARRIRRLHTQPDRGSHAVEYAIGIGLAAAATLALFAAYRTGLGQIISTWVFSAAG